MKHFSLAVDAAANKLGMQPTDAEWCFANRTKSDKVTLAGDTDVASDLAWFSGQTI